MVSSILPFSEESQESEGILVSEPIVSMDFCPSTVQFIPSNHKIYDINNSLEETQMQQNTSSADISR